MAIDLTKDTGLSPTQAAKLVPSWAGRPSHPSKIVRWIKVGLTVNGERIKLEALRMGGTWVTTAQALHEFGERLTRAEQGEDLPCQSISTTARRREVELAERTLDRVGI